ncbi:MAG: hypothetical protein G01um101438_875 [Parcubacteria group bacterium Gr01-1014_38]|nr:MAG: hypothetical protein G01um101438_875 [Parcubacteria group bacterium Gr01-1014_38]
MKVFIFGAGVSLGAQEKSGTQARTTPPLTQDLFSPNYKDSAEAVGLPNAHLDVYREQLRKSKSLEAWLTAKWEHIQQIGSPEHRRWELNEFGKITFYIWRLIQGVSTAYNTDLTLYRHLLRKIRANEEAYGLITFNYDTLLDRAVQEEFGCALIDLDVYEQARYVKLHGSINWLMRKRPEDRSINRVDSAGASDSFRILASNMYKEAALSAAGLMVIDPSSETMNNLNGLRNVMISTETYYPLLFLPVTTKQYAYVHGFEEKVMQQARNMLQQAQHIYLIGYQAQDEIIRDVMSGVRPNTPLQVVSRNAQSAVQISDRVVEMCQNVLPARGGHNFNGFEDFVRQYEPIGL